VPNEAVAEDVLGSFICTMKYSYLEVVIYYNKERHNKVEMHKTPSDLEPPRFVTNFVVHIRKRIKAIVVGSNLLVETGVKHSTKFLTSHVRIGV
jgi:hypothetical protein